MSLTALEITTLSIQGIKLLTHAYEAAQAGDLEAATAYLEAVAQRSQQARTRWENSKRGQVFE